MLTFQVQGKILIIKMNKYDTGCKKLYLWIMTMCLSSTRDKIKGLQEFAALDQAREFHDLIKMIKSTTLQLE